MAPRLFRRRRRGHQRQPEFSRRRGLGASGNLYIADYHNNRIRKVDTNGIITTVAGNGSAGYSGDGGAATNASLYSPTAWPWMPSGNLYIADQSNARIRKVDINGIITTVAGNGSATRDLFWGRWRGHQHHHIDNPGVWSWTFG